MNEAKIAWPPDVTIKKHHRAKRVTLKANVDRGLELIVPLRFNVKQVPAILEENRHWIEKHLQQINTKIAQQQLVSLPKKIELLAINEIWDIDYVATSHRLQIIQRPHQALVLMGAIHDTTACKKMLVEWIKDYAKSHLFALLTRISQQINLPFTKVTLRDQQTRWGSCSREKSINLNYKLIFFPDVLARHVMIHELCHTVHFNHSDRFWQLVAAFDPDWKQHAHESKRGHLFIPDWLV